MGCQGGEHSKPILNKYLDSEDVGEFFTAVYSLLRMGEAEQNEVMEINERLASWLTSDSPMQKAVAAEALGYKRYSKALFPLLKNSHRLLF